MSSLEREYDAIVRRELKCQAAWLPVVSQAQVGDYGVISGGVFHKLGNVASDFNIALKTSDGEPGKLNFVSSSASVVRFVGDAQVAAFPAGSDGAGRMDIRFADASSFVLKAHEVTQRGLDNVAQVARRIGQDHRKSWRFLKYYVVSRVLTGKDIVFLSTRSADTTISFSGSADALRMVDGAGARAGVDIAWNKEVGLEMVGRTGPIGLNLFRVRWLGHSPVFRGQHDDDPTAAGGPVEAVDLDADLDDTI